MVLASCTDGTRAFVTNDVGPCPDLLSHACSRNVCVVMSAAVRVSRPGPPPSPPVWLGCITLVPHSQSAILVSLANYFTGACTLLGALCGPVCLPAIHNAVFTVNTPARIVVQRAAVVSVVTQLRSCRAA